MKPFLLETSGSEFLRDGRPHRIFGGALHYFRVPPDYWEDRLRKYAACGLNTVETYVPWNLHEPTPGHFDFSGPLDLQRFIQTAGTLGLDVIVRPGPYICAEWENGGIPAWLLKDRALRTRTAYPPFLSAAVRYFKKVADEIRGFQSTQGGPVVAVQVENEYGSFGNDRAYLSALENALRESGLDVLFFTSDDASDYTLRGGTLPHLLKTVNFGSRPEQAFQALRRHQPSGPLVCAELWLGWFDHWGKPHHTRDAQDAAQTLDQLLSLGGSFCIYMMHGGTNFGFLNGANLVDGVHAPVTTSYDYDAPLDERGAPTEKFFALRDVLKRHGATPGELPEQTPAAAYGPVLMEECCGLFDLLPALPPPLSSPYPLSMEEAGQNFGSILYRTILTGPMHDMPLTITEVRDRALVFQDGRYLGTVDRNAPQPLGISFSGDSSRLDILVENLGRINHGAQQPDCKGITRCVQLGVQAHAGWEIFPLDFTRLPMIPWQDADELEGSAFYRGTFSVTEAQDTFLEVSGRHGAAWINGFCLGRYWEIGPQRRLYVPGTLLRESGNELVIFEMDPGKPPSAAFFDAPVWGTPAESSL